MECKWYQVCPMKYYTDRGVLDEKWVKTYCKGDWSKCLRYHMEEQNISHPDYMLPDGSIDKKLKKIILGI